jgi:replicative DNA helicase
MLLAANDWNDPKAIQSWDSDNGNIYIIYKAHSRIVASVQISSMYDIIKEHYWARKIQKCGKNISMQV